MRAKTLASDVTASGERESGENLVWLRWAKYGIGTIEFRALDTDCTLLHGTGSIKAE